MKRTVENTCHVAIICFRRQLICGSNPAETEVLPNEKRNKTFFKHYMQQKQYTLGRKPYHATDFVFKKRDEWFQVYKDFDGKPEISNGNYFTIISSLLMSLWLTYSILLRKLSCQ